MSFTKGNVLYYTLATALFLPALYTLFFKYDVKWEWINGVIYAFSVQFILRWFARKKVEVEKKGNPSAFKTVTAVFSRFGERVPSPEDYFPIDIYTYLPPEIGKITSEYAAVIRDYIKLWNPTAEVNRVDFVLSKDEDCVGLMRFHLIVEHDLYPVAFNVDALNGGVKDRSLSVVYDGDCVVLSMQFTLFNTKSNMDWWRF